MSDTQITIRNTSIARLERSLTATSLRDLARARKAENVFLLIDCSGSMADQMLNGRTRIDGLRRIVAEVQQTRPAPMAAFGVNDTTRGVKMVTGAKIPDAVGFGTPLAEAIDFAREQGAGRLVVISDGIPDSTRKALAAAAKFGGRIDVVFVGDAGDPGSAFLDELATATGGERFEGDISSKQLGGAVIGLLNGDVAAASLLK